MLMSLKLLVTIFIYGGSISLEQKVEDLAISLHPLAAPGREYQNRHLFARSSWTKVRKADNHDGGKAILFRPPHLLQL